jgi:acylphosphatase
LKSHFEVKITGLVQGVSFRHRCLQKALELGITGWVKNESDGTVCISAEGNQTNLDELISWINHSPGGSVVKNVDLTIGKVVNYLDFRVF